MNSVSLFDPKEAYSGPAPIAVLVETDPWAMVIGADTPKIVIYGDGTIIYCKAGEKNNFHYKKAQVSSEKLKYIVDKILSFGSYDNLENYYEIHSEVTDQPTSKIYLNYSGNEFSTQIYGLSVSDLESRKNSGIIPEQVLDLYNYLSGLEFENSEDWIPKYVTLIIWPFEHSRGRSVKWPKNWPGICSPQSFKQGDSYSIFLEGTELMEIKTFLDSLKPNKAISLDHRKWAVSLKYIFPSEPSWFYTFL